jgi:predicted metal-dependent hydrolase
MIEYQLVRSNRRKSIALQVQQGVVTVRAPQYVKESYIQQLVLQKTPWLEAKLLLQKKVQEELQNDQNISLNDNGCLWFYGIKKNISISFSNKYLIESFTDTINISLLKRYQNVAEPKLEIIIKRRVEAWFKEEATKVLLEKVEHFSHLFNLFPSEIYVRQYKARWGSCNNRRQLSFNYLLIMTPDWIIDYVVIHELCHLKHLNHSRQFWLLVEHHFPRFREAKFWLKTHQTQLKWPSH